MPPDGFIIHQKEGPCEPIAFLTDQLSWLNALEIVDALSTPASPQKV
jgi:hypothetical protein